MRPHVKDDDGATAAEYALLVAAVAAVIVAIVFLFGGGVRNLFSNSCATVNTRGQTTTATGTCS